MGEKERERNQGQGFKKNPPNFGGKNTVHGVVKAC